MTNEFFLEVTDSSGKAIEYLESLLEIEILKWKLGQKTILRLVVPVVVLLQPDQMVFLKFGAQIFDNVITVYGALQIILLIVDVILLGTTFGLSGVFLERESA